MPSPLDNVLFRVLQKTAKAIQLYFIPGNQVNAGAVGEYTDLDEAAQLVESASPAAIRIVPHMAFQSVAAEPTLTVGECRGWYDSVNDKYYICVGITGGNKKVELV